MRADFWETTFEQTMLGSLGRDNMFYTRQSYILLDRSTSLRGTRGFRSFKVREV